MVAGEIVQHSNHASLSGHTVKVVPGHSINLACKCNVDTPQWTVEYVSSSLTYTKKKDVLCHNTTSTDGSCSDTYICSSTNTKYLYIDMMAIVNETIIFKCHTSDLVRYAEPVLAVMLVEDPREYSLFYIKL